jgi:hypothetical protein
MSKLNINIKIPKNVSKKTASAFFLKNGFKKLVQESFDRNKNSIPDLNQTLPFKPQLIDLYRIYQFIILNKRTTVVEFGCGWSSAIIMAALNKLHSKYHRQIKNLRRKHPFELIIVDSEKKYIKIAKKRINLFSKKRLKYKTICTQSRMTTFNGRICSEYKKLPLVNPDFIYLDGPGQEDTLGLEFGINVKHQDFMPMSCDILKIENFLIPGTIILIDGRTANARFLKNNFQRDWQYIHDKKNDQSIFILNEDPLGHVNKTQLNFYLNKT